MGRWGDGEMGRWGDGEIGGTESCTFDRNLVINDFWVCISVSYQHMRIRARYANSHQLSAISYQLSVISLWVRSQARSLCHAKLTAKG